MGRLIPAGTGLAKYKDVGIKVDAPEGVESGAEEEDSLVEPIAAPEPIAPSGLSAGGRGESDPLKV